MAAIDDRWDGPSTEAGPASGAYHRQPPQDLAAEQSVLGGMLLSKDAIADVVESIRSGDFYKPSHAVIFDTVLDLYARGEPADPITVSAELDRRGALSRAGGAVYLHTLISMVPTAANAGYYAQIVAEKAILRRLVEAGTRITRLGYGGGDGQPGSGEVDEIVDRAEREIYEVTERRTSEDYVVLEELLQPTMDEIDAIASRGGQSSGVPTGFIGLDELTNGLHPGQMVIIAARPGVGKALALDTPLAGPSGWTTMGEVRVGDQLFGADGRPVTVVAATEVMLCRPCFEVEFSDGEVIVADAEHQWLTETRASRRSVRSGAGRHGRPGAVAEVRTTEQIRGSLHTDTAGRRPNHAVRVTRPLDLPPAELPVPPYSLGVWLAVAMTPSATRAPADPEIAAYLEAEGVPAPWLDAPEQGPSLPEPAQHTELAGPESDLVAAGHIPTSYLRAGEAQRRALLAGLLDGRGTVGADGRVRFSSTDPRLAGDVRELIASLGYRPSTAGRPVRGEGEPGPVRVTVSFSTDDDVFRLERKRLAHKERNRTAGPTRGTLRYIVDVRPVASVPVRCVQVDSHDHLYLAGPSMIPTHNSTLALDWARSAAVRHRMPTVIFSLEMSRSEITMRLLSAEAEIKLASMRNGRMGDVEWQKIVRRMSEITDAPLFIDDSPNMTMMEIRAKARRLKQRHGLRLAVVDYMQLMTSNKRTESRQQEVSEISRQMKLLAKELEIPVVAISQLNRGPEQRTDKRPMLADLRESGSLEQDADMVILVHRPDAWEADDPRAGEADLIVAKHRNGPTATVTVAHQLHYSRFKDLAGA